MWARNGVAWLPLDSGHRTAVRNRAIEAATLLAIDVDDTLALSKRVALQLAARAILDNPGRKSIRRYRCPASRIASR